MLQRAVGEIAVKSRYIAPAYWRQPELTASAFRPDPAGSGERIYRSARRQARLLRQLLGEQRYRTLLWETERL